MLRFPAKTFESDWLLRFLILIIICSIFVQSSDWLMRFLIIICSILVQSSDWLMQFLIIICSVFGQNFMSEIEWVKEILQSKI